MSSVTRISLGVCVRLLALGLLVTAEARGEGLVTYRFQPGGRVTGVRSADVDADGRLDLVVLLSRPTKDDATVQQLLVLRTPRRPRVGSFYGEDDVHVSRLALDEGPLATAGALVVGRFGPEGTVLLRFLGTDGITDLAPTGEVQEPTPRHDVRTLLGRSRGQPLVFWDEVADLDGDGIDECWFPLAEGNGSIRIFGGVPSGDRTLDLEALNSGATDDRDLVRRHAYVPKLAPADLDGDGRIELVAHRAGKLIAWPATGSPPERPVKPALLVDLPLGKEDLHPDEIHTPRFQLADADQNGTTDLLVTLVTGNRTKLGSFRTRFLYLPGPILDRETGRLAAPRARIDTESVALHPRFIDLDGDGDLDYLGDSIRGTKLDLFRRVLGQEPTIWHVAFRYDAARRTYERTPYFSIERPYSREEAVSNRFGISAYFAGDFDADGHKDLLDLGNLSGVEIQGAVPKRGRGPGDPVAFTRPLLDRKRVASALVGDALVLDFEGDGASEAVVWNEDSLFVITRGGRR